MFWKVSGMIWKSSGTKFISFGIKLMFKLLALMLSKRISPMSGVRAQEKRRPSAVRCSFWRPAKPMRLFLSIWSVRSLIKGLLKRFNVNCYGDEKTIVEVRSDKAAKYEELKHQKEGKEYNKYFFKYIPVKGRKQKSAYQTKLYKPIYPNKKTRKNKVKNIFGNIW